jgi:cation diffusion facilitator family transporter
MSTNNKTKYIRIAAIIALSGTAILSTLLIIVGIISNSSALIGSGIDSSTDVLISIITLIVAKIISKPADKGHPWGHGRAETVTTILLSFIIFFAGAQLMLSSITGLIVGREEITSSLLAIIITLVTIVGKSLLAWNQYALGKRADSQMIKANAKNMASDIIISVGVLIGLVISTLTGWAYADSIIALLIGVWIIKTAIGIFLESNLELMDGNKEMEPYRVIVEAVNAVEGATNPHRARVRRIAGFWDIDLDIDVNPKITVEEAHRIASKVEKEIKKRLDNVFDIMIHIEPLGNTDDEMYGLSEKEIIEENAE